MNKADFWAFYAPRTAIVLAKNALIIPFFFFMKDVTTMPIFIAHIVTAYVAQALTTLQMNNARP